MKVGMLTGMRRVFLLFGVVVLLVVAACSGSSGPDAPEVGEESTSTSMNYSVGPSPAKAGTVGFEAFCEAFGQIELDAPEGERPAPEFFSGMADMFVPFIDLAPDDHGKQVVSALVDQMHGWAAETAGMDLSTATAHLEAAGMEGGGPVMTEVGLYVSEHCAPDVPVLDSDPSVDDVDGGEGP